MTNYKILYNFYEDLPIIRIKRFQLNVHQTIFASISFFIFLMIFAVLMLMHINFFLVIPLSLPIPILILVVGNFNLPKYDLTLDRYIILTLKYNKKQKFYPYRKRGVK
ncbi:MULTISPECIES: hypothetical protein [Thermoanaerobacterium]|uniref:PrgI family protein n=3 Tax=Thermoanaerobacterium TaxID=28895 RepID=L0IR18_THETR|nr:MULTISPECIES: hypothetical protein [Thermoanaerobacterium]AFK94247.1 hypothetical protein Tsac_2698 [Thermoanaerobacterium saccharolyticum JW/SL-YS485]AGB20422.1 hypothetical protein Thethe_02873 [Thermoanaerobacterium thermosaccharolyticum M0795]ETO39157.1 hypothetical protein V518_0745 [Thermoanaerobacterium aotearoense SCUT27]